MKAKSAWTFAVLFVSKYQLSATQTGQAVLVTKHILFLTHTFISKSKEQYYQLLYIHLQI